MREYKKIIRRKLFLDMLVNPLFIFIYSISMYELYSLCKYGITLEIAMILGSCNLFHIIWLVIFIVKSIRKPVIMLEQIVDKYEFSESCIKIFQPEETLVWLNEVKCFKVNKEYCFIVLKNKNILLLDMVNKTSEDIKDIKRKLDSRVRIKSSYKVTWTYIAIAIIVGLTSFYGYKICKTAINYSGKIAWVLEDLKNKRTIKFEHNNIYEYGIEGIFEDINKKIDMPRELYISETFDLTFSEDGTVTSFYTFIYGKDDNGKEKSFLISYDSNKSEKIIVRSGGYVNSDYIEDKRLSPLITTMNIIPFKEIVNKYDENEYGILYKGKRSWGYNTDGIVYIDINGNTKKIAHASSEIVGYTVSVFVPGKEDRYIPTRYNLVDNLENIHEGDLANIKNNENNSDKLSEEVKKPRNTAEEFYLSDKVGYNLDITGAAAGSRFYSLFGTSDGGNNWNIVNEDPFLGRSGGASGMTFINDKLGFLCLSHSGGSYAELYRTEDGGVSYEQIEFPEVKISLDSSETYNPFDFPGMPYEENGVLNILVGQGDDGDYNGNCEGLYISKDNGITWEYVMEV